MAKPSIVLDKRFARAEVHYSEGGIVCYQADGSTGVGLSEWIEYAIDTIRGQRRGAQGYILRDFRILIEIVEVVQPAPESIEFGV